MVPMHVTPSTRQIQPVALCVFRRNHSILVIERFDPCKEETFYRPLGGGVAFGEYSWETIRRDIKQELDEEIQNLNFVGPAENVFELYGQTQHEIVFIFEAEFIRPDAYHQEELHGRTPKGEPYQAIWKPLGDFKRGKAILYPEGLLEMLLG